VVAPAVTAIAAAFAAAVASSATVAIAAAVAATVASSATVGVAAAAAVAPAATVAAVATAVAAAAVTAAIAIATAAAVAVSSSTVSVSSTSTTTTSSPSSSSGGMAASPAAAASGRRLRVSLVALAAWYGFAGPLLGTQDLGACNMYSNLRMHGGSNHLLLPTDLLGSLFPGTSVAFAMRTVRVEHTSSAWINSIYPNEITSQMSPKERTVLREAGHLARMFNPMKSRILSPAIGAPPPAYAAPPGSDGRPFARWTVPTLELRRLLAEAREQGEAFSLTYTLLDGQSGDERWRRSGGGRTVTITEDGKGGRTCTLCPDLMASLMGSLAGGCACADDELPLMPPPPYLARKLLVQQPYPIVGDERDDPEANFICYGP
jgi:hypothetical protein